MGKKWGNALGGYKTQRRDKGGRFSGGGIKVSRGGIVPYVRTSLRGTTGGVNAGAQVSKNKRVSAGFYVRLESVNSNKLERGVKSADRKAMDAIVGKVSPNRILDPYVEAGIRKLEEDIVSKSGVGKERSIAGKNAFGRLTTTRSGMPSYTVRFGSPKFKKKPAMQARSRQAQVAYNKQMAAGKKVKQNRPQRRGK